MTLGLLAIFSSQISLEVAAGQFIINFIVYLFQSNPIFSIYYRLTLVTVVTIELKPLYRTSYCNYVLVAIF